MLDTGCGVDDIAEYIAFLEKTKAVMQTHADMNLLDFFAPLTVFLERPLHAYGGFHRSNLVFKAGHDGVANRFHDAAAFAFDDRKQDAVMAIDHRHACQVTFLFECLSESSVCGRALRLRLEHFPIFNNGCIQIAFVCKQAGNFISGKALIFSADTGNVTPFAYSGVVVAFLLERKSQFLVSIEVVRIHLK